MLLMAICACTSASAPAPSAQSVKALPCTREAAAQADLSATPTASIALGGNPFDVAVTADGRWAFASLSSGALAVLAVNGTATKLTRKILLPGAPNPTGLALTHDGHYLLAADGAGGAIVVRVDLAISEDVDPVVGHLSGGGDAGAIGVITSADDSLAFVSLEARDAIAVFDLRSALASGFRDPALLGTIPVGAAPVGLAISLDGRWLYATSELASRTASSGTLSVIDVRRAATRPRDAVVTTATAGCSPVRVAVGDDGVVWVTARGSNALLGFDAARLVIEPDHAMVANVLVGQAPVGLAVARGGTRVAVADSNRFGVLDSTSGITLVDAAAALASKPAVLGVIPAGAFPRGIAFAPDARTLLVANFDSRELELVDLTGVP